MKKKKIIEILKEMQIQTAKCNGLFGLVSREWVIKELLGNKIEELGGKPYVVKGNKLIVEKEQESHSNDENKNAFCRSGGDKYE